MLAEGRSRLVRGRGFRNLSASQSGGPAWCLSFTSNRRYGALNGKLVGNALDAGKQPRLRVFDAVLEPYELAAVKVIDLMTDAD
jgi:hypothetical protein